MIGAQQPARCRAVATLISPLFFILALLVIAVNVVLVVQFVDVWPPIATICVCLYGCFYAFLCVSMVWDDFKALVAWLTGGRVSVEDSHANSLDHPFLTQADSSAKGSAS